MQLQHRFSVPIGIDDAWAAFTDIERIAPCLPGAAITSVDGDEFEGTAKVKLGPISLQYAGKGTWVSRDASTYSAVIDAQGKDKRGNGTAGATIAAHLEPDGEATVVVVDTELKVTGRPAQFGRGVIQDVGTKLLDQFAACLAVRLAEPAQTPMDLPAEAAVPPPLAIPQPSPPAAAVSAPPAIPPTRAPTAAVPPGSPAAPPSEPTEVNLGSVVGPVLLKRYGAWLGGLAVVAIIVWLVTRG
ncbi:SRPBCC family protein [Angustibacter sp. McL0619]|uniref:SRPBCC family protein n=1 Tax=Angustibacter sp. McL0619 TaxID=3415676 RepID=UPI003CF73584